MTVEEGDGPAAGLLRSICRFTSNPTTGAAGGSRKVLNPRQRSQPLVYRGVAIESMRTESIPNLSGNLVAMFEKVVDDLSRRGDAPVGLGNLPDFFAVGKPPNPVTGALREVSINQDRNPPETLRQQLTLRANRWPFFGVERLIHFGQNIRCVTTGEVEMKKK